MNAEVIVVGAGISGLSAAKLLSESGVSVIILEARDRVGGRTWTKRDPKVGYVDIGGAYIGVTQNRMLRMAKELGIENYVIKEVEDCLYYKNGRRTRFKTNDVPSQTNPLVNMDLNNIFYLMGKMSEEIPAEAPWKAPHAEEWDTITLKEFFNKHCWSKGSLEFLENVIATILTSQSHEVSLLSFLWCIKLYGGLKRMLSVTHGSQERKFKGGSQQISEKIAEKLGDSVILECPVIEINQESKDMVLVKALNGKEYKAKYVIMAVPPILLMKIHFTPSMPPLRNQLIQRMPMGAITKFILYYSKPFWKENGLCGTMLIEGGDEHPAFFCMDDTKPDGSYPALIGFYSGDTCREILKLSKDERQGIMARSIAEVTGLSEALNMIHYEEKNWMEEQYSGGGYSHIYTTGVITRYASVLRTPVDRLYFAGTETALEWPGYMEGAIEAGERTTREILYKMGKITQNQIIQKEPQSKDYVVHPFDPSFLERYIPSVPGALKILTLSFMGLIVLCSLKFQDVAFLPKCTEWAEKFFSLNK